MGNIEITTKLSRLKSVSSTDVDYLEAATRGVLWKVRNIYRKTPVLEPLFDKVADLQVYWKETPTLVLAFAC